MTTPPGVVTSADDEASALREELGRRAQTWAMALHELRGPLSAIHYAAQALELHWADRDEVARVLARQTSHLLRLVEDLMQASRAAGDDLDLRRQKVELRELCEGAIEATRGAFAKNGIDLSVRLPSHAVWLHVDPLRVQQILWNLLGNAAKHSAPGRLVTLSARVSGPRVYVEISDGGCGMSTELLSRAFEPYVQADAARGGLGLGLPLSRRIAELHGGTLTASSPGPGRGSRMVLTLPRPRRFARVRVPRSADDERSGRVSAPEMATA